MQAMRTPSAAHSRESGASTFDKLKSLNELLELSTENESLQRQEPKAVPVETQATYNNINMLMKNELKTQEMNNYEQQQQVFVEIPPVGVYKQQTTQENYQNIQKNGQVSSEMSAVLSFLSRVSSSQKQVS